MAVADKPCIEDKRRDERGEEKEGGSESSLHTPKQMARLSVIGGCTKLVFTYNV